MTGISQTVNEAAGFQIPFSDNETTLPSPFEKGGNKTFFQSPPF